MLSRSQRVHVRRVPAVLPSRLGAVHTVTLNWNASYFLLITKAFWKAIAAVTGT